MIEGAASFRDPDGVCFLWRKRVFRFVRAHAAQAVRDLIASSHFHQWVKSGWVAATWEVDLKETGIDLAQSGWEGVPALVLEQERIPFVSYAHEWCPEMLHSAAVRTLELQMSALAEGLMLKDATTTNILFRGSQPVFVDVLSFVRRPSGMVVWPAYAQFVRNFLLPLLLHRRRGGGIHEVFLCHRDGLEPEDVYKWLSWPERLFPTVLRYVSLPTWLGSTKAAQESKPSHAKSEPEVRAKELAPMLIEGLRQSLQALRPVQRRTAWSDYTKTSTYDSNATHVKERFVRDALEGWKARSVLDVGSNTGHYSAVAAAIGATVVALDYDPEVVDAIFRGTPGTADKIHPLVVNLARPSPAIGWDYTESSSFLERANGAFDAAMLLAVIHHLTVTDGVPLAAVFHLLSKMVTGGAIVEYVPTDDPQFQRIIRNKEHLIPLLGQLEFERAFSPWFIESSRVAVPGCGRVLFALNLR